MERWFTFLLFCPRCTPLRHYAARAARTRWRRGAHGGIKSGKTNGKPAAWANIRTLSVGGALRAAAPPPAACAHRAPARVAKVRRRRGQIDDDAWRLAYSCPFSTAPF